MKKNTKSILLLLCILLFSVTSSTVSQTLLKPELQFERACDNGILTEFKVEFNYTTKSFDAENQFTIEMSNANGAWDAPINLGVISTENTSYSFFTDITLPDHTFGTSYKIRLVSSSPVMISPESDIFEAYKMVNGTLVLNNYKNVVLCGGGSTELTLNTTQKGQYEWYKNNVFVTLTNNPVLKVTETGKYQVKINYGGCGYVSSTTIDVSILNEADQQIKGASLVEVCGDEQHTFEANFVNSLYTYNWYLNNNLMQSSNSSTYTTPSVGQFGVYQLEIETGSCTTISENVTLSQKTQPSFSITENTPLESVLLPGEYKDLSITVTNVGDFTVEWYKDGNRLFGVNETTLNVNQPGDYVARVVETTIGGCVVVADSQVMRLLTIKSFELVIGTDDTYQECSNTAVNVDLQQANVVDEVGNIYPLTTEQLSLLSYQWVVDNVNILGATTKQLSLNSHTQTGIYKLNISIGTFNNISSNELDIKLMAAAPIVTSFPNSNTLCPGSSITYTIDGLDVNYTYEWFKDGDILPIASNVASFEVTEIGNYILKMSGFGCEKNIKTISVVLFDSSIISTTPSGKVVLAQGETVIVKASGADTYTWYEGIGINGTLLSSTEALSTNTVGYYTVVATIGGCSIEKTIEVIEQDTQVIVPNIITPNQDGINDSWQLSNKYAFQPLVIIKLYDSNGKEILNRADYQNDWPIESLGNQKIFYYKIIKENVLIKAGTISVLD
ncbi:gliding motility-associated C-terminal domain-containing protein [Tenacibaculum aestuariivivum]|uniref:T9SS type B sorting domain-containing protein n=1 Tax=Tenacibaculum aestuariivivum TaxID=2006131 RepID=UPI003AB22D86